jgi:hypothetical protein
MPYQYVREPLTAEEADRLANACETPTEQLFVWTLLDNGLRVSEANQASCLKPVTNAMISWNTVYMGAAGPTHLICRETL